MAHRYHFPSELARKAQSNRARCKAYYAANQASLQKKNRERAACRRARMTEEELAEARARHNANAARYREQNRRVLREASGEYRRQKRYQREVEEDAADMAAEIARLEMEG
ncbi:hypothetical protein H0H93_016714 [Arthromyces matolae]|nr:hypothetical protein H0H93_016714 [Arthromyces matolae]